MNPIVVIPARGGSKGVPGKNIKKLGGKPLIEYTISAAREVFDDRDIIVSTDDIQIRKAVEKTGLKVPFLRPESLATDHSSTQDVLIHALEYFESLGNRPDSLILLQPTSPFRNSKHIMEAMEIYKSNPGVEMVVSVKETGANPYYVLFEEDIKGFLKKSKEGNFTRRQDCPKVWEYNGAIYIINVSGLQKKRISEFKKVKKYVMDKRSSMDIDDEYDWMLAELMLLQ